MVSVSNGFKWFVSKLQTTIDRLPASPEKNKANAKLVLLRQRGNMNMGLLEALIGVVVVLIVIFRAFPILWPMATDASANITAMSGTDAGTTTVQGFMPVVLLIVGLGIGIGLIVFALRQFGLLGGGG